MKKSTLVIIVLIIAALGVGGLFALSGRPKEEDSTPESDTTQNAREDADSPQQENTPDTPEMTTDKIEIKDFAFGPINTTVKKGTAVTWTNKDGVQHSVEPDEESDAFQGSELLAKDESYSFTFNTAGTYSYHCGPHPNMTGTVTVTE